MTVTGIATQSGASVRTVRSWIQKAAQKSASIKEKGQAAKRSGNKQPAEYNQADVRLILSFRGRAKSAAEPVKKARK